MGKTKYDIRKESDSTNKYPENPGEAIRLIIALKRIFRIQKIFSITIYSNKNIKKLSKIKYNKVNK